MSKLLHTLALAASLAAARPAAADWHTDYLLSLQIQRAQRHAAYDSLRQRRDAAQQRHALDRIEGYLRRSQLPSYRNTYGNPVRVVPQSYLICVYGGCF